MTSPEETVAPAIPTSHHRQLLAEFAERKPAALARVISIVENHRAGFESLLGEMHPALGRARRVGITGPPGAGKSTLVTQLVRVLRARGSSVAVVAVDPTSPFTGGALLGDRIRMEEVALDPGVFIRSMATRGSLGGIAAGTGEVADVLDAFGYEWILLETVGVGQSELDVARMADTTVVVLVPESGDSIQTLKAGLMEIADVFVVNKADRPGADRLRTEVGLMLKLRGGQTMPGVPAVDAGRAGGAASAWVPPVLGTVASAGEGVASLLGALDEHLRYLESSGALRAQRRGRLRDRVVTIVEQKVRERLWTDGAISAWLDDQLPALEAGAANPFAIADRLLERSGHLLSRGTR